jgi:hypothetical protein
VARILNAFERAALLALSKSDLIPAHGEVTRGFSAVHLSALRSMGMATLLPPRSAGASPMFAVTDEGWRCMYGMTRRQIETSPLKPVAFRVWQYPPAGPMQVAS